MHQDERLIQGTAQIDKVHADCLLCTPDHCLHKIFFRRNSRTLFWSGQPWLSRFAPAWPHRVGCVVMAPRRKADSMDELCVDDNVSCVGSQTSHRTGSRVAMRV
eukprot:1977252-Amphidinium_carterae.1